MRIALFLMVMAFSVATALAQSAPPLKDALQDDVPLDVYLDALTQISPAAREGADTYLQAFKRRCGRPLKAIELRLAIADGSGDPVLMAMMRAASQRDAVTLQRLSGTLSCARGK
jgi:hypothetical protein